ncbi:MAG: DUF4093 domain-containing protein [Oscillospiraceae bacterium]|nr:DUF4093 domain-containing protein [Oscillospiraceae bacterium]
MAEAAHDKIPIAQAIFVEGKYDAIRLGSLFKALIVPVHGFQIYKNDALRQLAGRLAAQRGLVIATDSDAAGLQIRNYLREGLPAGRVWHVVIPTVPGKEKRKTAPSKAGTLGVEGMESSVLLRAFAPVIAAQEGAPPPESIDKMTLYRDGFSGKEGSRARFAALLRALNLPEQMTVNTFCACVGPEAYARALERVAKR